MEMYTMTEIIHGLQIAGTQINVCFSFVVSMTILKFHVNELIYKVTHVSQLQTQTGSSGVKGESKADVYKGSDTSKGTLCNWVHI